MNTDDRPTAAAPPVADPGPTVQLIVQKGPLAGSTIPCRRVITLLGSREGCKVVLQHRRIAPVHTALVNDGSHVVAVDLLTPTGTLLNGLRMQYEPLASGDLLTLDQWEFRVEIQQPERSGDADVHPFDLEPTPNLVALEHMASGRVLQPGRDVCIIGRRNGCDITVADPSVSRAHALLVTYFGYPAIFDLLTTQGTQVNGSVVRFQTLKDNDLITIGESEFRVRLVGSTVTERASKNHKVAQPPAARVSEPRQADLVDIHTVEGSERWSVAESLEKLEKAGGKR